MTHDVPNAALAVSLWGQDPQVDMAALDRLKSAVKGIRLFAICLEGTVLPASVAFDRVIHLPIGHAQLRLAEAIGMQLCLNEGSALVGALRHLDARHLDDAGRHLEELSSGRADVVVLAEDDPREACLFVSQRAAFLASSWGALGADLAAERLRIASALLALSGCAGVVFRGHAGSYVALPACAPADLAHLADGLRKKLGLFIGGAAPPRVRPVRRVAVVTPYYKEPDAELRRMISSVAAQTAACHHFMVSDGFPNDLARVPGVSHIELGMAHGDNGNTPRYVGALVALAQGYDAVAFLDADNWFEPKHVDRLVSRQHESGAAAVFSLRNIYLPDGTKVPGQSGEDRIGVHADTSCMLITSDCEYALHLWGQMPQEWSPACDRVIFSELNGQRIAWNNNRTLNFKSHYELHYQVAGRPVPADVHDMPIRLARAFRDMPPDYRSRSVSRTGRIIALNRQGLFRKPGTTPSGA